MMTIITSTGAERIATERARQIAKEGYDAAHDDEHEAGELADAAACYAAARNYGDAISSLEVMTGRSHPKAIKVTLSYIN